MAKYEREIGAERYKIYYQNEAQEYIYKRIKYVRNTRSQLYGNNDILVQRSTLL